MEPRHLRGLEVGCGKHKQCVWLPMPHYKEAWCNGVDFLYSIDYEGMVDKGDVDATADVATLAASELRLLDAPSAPDAPDTLVGRASGAPLPSARVLKLTGGATGDPLSWLELGGFADRRWRSALPRRVGAALKGSFALDASQMTIMSDCMHSLATSRD